MSHRRRPHAPEALSVVERGWRGARECSITLSARAVPVTHLIKGSLKADLRAMIRPYPGVRLVSVPRIAFRAWLWALLVWGTMWGRLRWVLIDHERTLKEVAWWCRMCGLTSVFIQETGQGYDLRRPDGERLSVQALIGETRR
jgi:hypothetical protein